MMGEVDQEDFIEYQQRLNSFSKMFDSTNRCINADLRKMEKRFNDLERRRFNIIYIASIISVINFLIFIYMLIGE